MGEAELPPMPEHFCPIGLLGAPGYFQRQAREYAEEYARFYATPLLAEIERLRSDYENACKTIAQMHFAATGSLDGPRLGVVDDVRALRAELDSLRAPKDTTP